MEEVHQPSKLCIPKFDPPHQQLLVSSPNEVGAANDSSSQDRNVSQQE